MAQRIQTLWCDRTEGTPSPFELINLGKKSKKFLGNENCVSVDHTG
jgi:hypothetical protein